MIQAVLDQLGVELLVHDLSYDGWQISFFSSEENFLLASGGGESGVPQVEHGHQ